MNKKILELKVNNNKKDFEKYIQPQWSFKTLISIVIFVFVLIFVVRDLEINFIKLISDSSKYFIGNITSCNNFCSAGFSQTRSLRTSSFQKPDGGKPHVRTHANISLLFCNG